MPGFVDCHTHVVFGGSRVDEYVARCAGLEPPRRAPAGDRRHDGCDPAAGCPRAGRLPRPLACARCSRTAPPPWSRRRATASPATPSCAMLEANALLQREVGIDIVSTYLGAHALPPDVGRDAYVARGGRDDPGGRRARARVVLRRVLRRRLLHARREPADPRGGAGRTGCGRSSTWTPTPTPAPRCWRPSSARPPSTTSTTPARPSWRRSRPPDVIGVVMPLLDFAAQNPTPTHARTLLDSGVRIALATDICPGCYTREHAARDPARLPHRRALGRPGDPGCDARRRAPRSGAPTGSVRSNPESRPTS